MKYAIIMLDIDHTLATCVENEGGLQLKWVSDLETWREGLKQLKETALAQGITVLYGLNTLKPSPGDPLSALLTGELRMHTKILAEFEVALKRKLTDSELEGLEALLDPQLIFFVGDAYLRINSKLATAESLYMRELILHELYECKVKYGLLPAKRIIENRYNTTISPKNVWLIDDQLDICKAASKVCNAIFVGGLEDQSPAQQKEQVKQLLSNLLIQVIEVTQDNRNQVNSNKVMQELLIDAATRTAPRIIAPKPIKKVALLDLEGNLEENREVKSAPMKNPAVASILADNAQKSYSAENKPRRLS